MIENIKKYKTGSDQKRCVGGMFYHTYKKVYKNKKIEKECA